MTAHKSISINLNGIAYQLDELAFGLVDDYLKSVEKAFKSDEDSEELIRDFEQAIADKLEAAGINGRKVASLKLVKDVLDKIGPVKVIDDTTKSEEKTDSDKSRDSDSRGIKLETGKKLYKSDDNKIIDGVCAGLGMYFGVDPTWVRVAVLVLGLLTAVWPVIVGYIALSVILPVAKTAEQKLEAMGKPLDASNLAYQTKERLERAEQAAKSAIDQTSKSLQVKRGALDDIARFFDRSLRLVVFVIRRVVTLFGSGVSLAIFLGVLGFGAYFVLLSTGMFSTNWDLPMLGTSSKLLAGAWWGFATAFVALPFLGLAWFFAIADRSKFAKKPSSPSGRLGLLLVWLVATLAFIGLTGIANKDLNSWSRRHGMEVMGFGISQIPLEEVLTKNGITYTVRYAQNCRNINVVDDADFNDITPVMLARASEVITHYEKASVLKNNCGEIFSIEDSADCTAQVNISSRDIYISKSDMNAVDRGDDSDIRYITSKSSLPGVGYSERICW